MINDTKPSPSVTNSMKASVGETWASILTSWATETRTWMAVSQLFVNSNKVSALITNVSKP